MEVKPKISNGGNERDSSRLLTDIQAAHHLGITIELIYAYTQHGCGAEARKLSTVQRAGRTYFDKAELEDFDRYLRQPWVVDGVNRLKVPEWIEAHLRAESDNQCLRCGAGRGVETAHIEAWSKSRSHYHGNLVRICAACHKEHDRHKSLLNVELRRIKNDRVGRTKARLARQMGLVESRFSPPPSEMKFVGRTEELETLCTALEEGRAVLLQGPGGIGKTQLLLKALERRRAGGRVIWLDVEGYESPEDLMTALAMSSAELEAGDTLEQVVRALDSEECCVVLDGIEQLAEAGLDAVDDLMANVRKRMQKAQLVVTSQVNFPRTGFDRKLALSGLDTESCRRLFRTLVRDDVRIDDVSEAQLLSFAEGHPLALRLIAILVEYLESGQSALQAIGREGARVVEVPKRGEQNRKTSLDMCLSLAYRMLSVEEKRLLFVIASCPGGLFAHQLEHYGGSDTAMLAAALRRWSLVERRDVGVSINRWYALSPIRSIAVRRWREENEAEAKALTNDLLRDFGLMAVGIEENAQDTSDIPHMVWRFWLEWRNLQLVVNESEAHPSDSDLALLATCVCSSMVGFFFVARLPKLGVRMMIRGARIALRAGNWEEASGYIAEAASLAQRSDDNRLASEVEELLKEMPAEGADEGHIAITKAILANHRGDAHAKEKEARKAIEQYEGARDRLTLAGAGNDEAELVENRSSLSGAYQMLGLALLAQSMPGEACEAYESALGLVGGTSRPVNEGQILYQIGRCRNALGEYPESADYFARAAMHFQEIGMRDYLANALGSLGYRLLELGDSTGLPPPLPKEVLRDGIQDAVKSIQQSIVVQLQTGTVDSKWAIRKLFGTVVVLSLSGETESLGVAGQAVMEWTKKLRDAGETEEVARRAAFEILHLEALSELMMSIARVEDQARTVGNIRESDVDELVERCESLGILRGLESSGFEWLGLYSRRRWLVSEDVEADKP